MTGLTHQMGAAVEFIRAYKLEHGCAPSYVDIAEGLGLSKKSKANVHRIVVALEERGRIRRIPGPGRARTVELLPAAPVLTVELPPDLYALVKSTAVEAKVTTEAVVIEAVRDGFKHLSFQRRSQKANCETSVTGGAGPLESIRMNSGTPAVHSSRG